jgi:Ni/Co efflux regulator RcnB
MMAPMAATSAYAAPQRQDQARDNNRNNNDRRGDNDNRRGDNNRRNWDQSRDNGYFVGNRFHRGAPPAAVQRRADFRPGWQQWRRGERLSTYQRQHYSRVDYRSARLRAPPRGYQYVRDDHNDVLLIAIATGVIASIIASQ